jgi:transposase InsO family protein
MQVARYLIRDRDQVYGAAVRNRLRAMGIRDKPIAPGSPWQNGFAERLIGSIRRECVDHVIALGEAHLRGILQAYARYYNDLRTHRSLDKDAPFSRPGRRLIGRGGLAGSLRRLSFRYTQPGVCDILPYQPYRCSRIAFSASDFAKRLVHLSRPAYQFSRALF